MEVLIVICVIVFIPIAIIISIRLWIKNSQKKTIKRINSIIPYSETFNCAQYDKEISQINRQVFIDIPTDIKNTFKDTFITLLEAEKFISFYADIFNEANLISKRLQTHSITTSKTISKLINDYGAIRYIIKHHNEGLIQGLLDTYNTFFDHCLNYPLDMQQRRSIVSEEDNCLVVSSAGSGKTSSIIGKVKYLIQIKGIDPRRILLISYTNKAAAELTERMATDGLKGYTFHKLAIDIIGQNTGVKPSICDNTDALFVEIFHDLLEKNEKFNKSIVEYFLDYQNENQEWERRKNERREQLSEKKKNKIKVMFPDMDGKDIYVKSKEEQKICVALFSLGIKFRYEEPYEYQVADENHSQYHPDFSIYFEQNGETKRVYLEHFGVDKHSSVPLWFAEQKGTSYEQENKKYNDGITWKKETHKKYETKLLALSSVDFTNYTDIKDKLRTVLNDAGIPIQEKTNEELCALVLPKSSKQEKAFIRFVVTFITLVKSSCISIEEVLKKANSARDMRSVSIIKYIFLPVYERYIEELQNRHQIDFTDAILQATEICRLSHPVEYDYIIVDEFQDISIDRYNFLKVLREGNSPAKIYCVGDDWQSIYRFSGSDMSLFNNFSEYFGPTEINKIETTYRFGEPLVSLSSSFIQRNNAQIRKDIHSCRSDMKTDLEFCSYERRDYCETIGTIISSIPKDKSIFLLGRYSFDDYYLSFMYKEIKEGNKFYYIIKGRKIEFLTIHKSKGLEADYVILLQCNKDIYGFPSLVSDDPVLNYVLTKGDQFLFGEERRLFYVAITRAKIKTFVLYDIRFPSVFVKEFLYSDNISNGDYEKNPNAYKKWTKKTDQLLLQLHNEGKSVKYIAAKMGRSQKAIITRLKRLTDN